MSSEQKEETEKEEESAPTQVAAPKMSPLQRKKLITRFLVFLVLLAGVFYFVRQADIAKVHRQLISNASWDQVEGVRQLLKYPERYQPLEAGMVLDRLDLASLRYSGLEFRRCDFSGTRFDGSLFSDCRFIDCNFSGCDMREMEIRESVFDGCNFSYALFDETSFPGTEVTNCKFQNARISVDQIKETTGWENGVYDELVRVELGL